MTPSVRKERERNLRYWGDIEGTSIVYAGIESFKVICRWKDGLGKRVASLEDIGIKEMANEFVRLLGMT